MNLFHRGVSMQGGPLIVINWVISPQENPFIFKVIDIDFIGAP